VLAEAFASDEERLVQAVFEEFEGRQGSEVVGNVNVVFVQLQEFDVFLVFASAEDQPERTFLARDLLVFFEPAQIEFHLAGVGGLEFADLEVDGDKTAEAAMIEEEINVIVAIINRDAFLAGKESEVVAEFENETLHLDEDGGLKIFFDQPSVRPRKSRR
jgi:hypothetical protein